MCELLAGAQARRGDRARRRKRALRARARGARRGTRRCCSTSIPAAAGSGSAGARAPGQRPLARDREAFFALHARRAATSTSGLADAIVPGAGARRPLGRAAPAPARARRGAARHAAAVGQLELRGLPGVPRPRAARRRPGAGAVAARPRRLARRSASATRTSPALYGERLGELAGSVAIPPGEPHKTLAEAERVWQRAARGGADPRRPRRRARRRRRGRPRGLLRGHLPARDARRAGAHHASSPRSTPPTAARPASTCPRPRTTSAPTTSPRG